MRCPYPLAAHVVAVAAMCGARSSAGADEPFPYIAFAQQVETPVRSGPGDDFYETDRLSRGTEVEVYRHDRGEWCAVRPPDESFSWVAAECLELTDNPLLARVRKTPVKTRVGSRFNDIHDVEYVSLRQGEVLEVLGNQVLREASGDAPRRWYKVAPPAGEFRWIHKSHLSRQPPPHRQVWVAVEDRHDDQVDSPPPTIEPSQVAISESQPAADEHSLQTYPLSDTPDLAFATWQQDAEMDSLAVAVFQAPSQDRAPDDAGSTTNLAMDQPSSDEPLALWHAVGQPETLLTNPEPRSFNEQYGMLNLMLSRAILADIDQWDLAPVLDQVQLLVDQSESPQELHDSESLLAKVIEFQRLQSRHRHLAQTGAPSSELSAPVGLPELSPVATVSSTAPEMPRHVKRTGDGRVSIVSDTDSRRVGMPDHAIFDATGQLISVVTRRKDMPRFALSDDAGHIVGFVSAQEGVDLERYANQRVGIIGKSSYVRQFRTPHLLARRVVVLGGRDN